MIAPLSRLALIAGLTATLVAGCSQTRSVAVSGVVLDLSGAPASGAQITAAGDRARSQTAFSGEDGQFDLVVERTRSGVVLPASGVYVDPVAVAARTSDAMAYSAASALSTSQVADGPAILILLPSDTVFSQAGCVSDAPQEAYAFALAARLGEDQAWLAPLRRSGATAGLHQQVRADIGAAVRRCNLPQTAWRSAYDAVDAALDPSQER